MTDTVALDLLPGAVVVVDAARVVQYANEAMAGLLGAPRDALVGAPFADLVYPEDRARAAAMFDRLDAAPQVGAELRAGAPGGPTRWLSLQATRLPDGRTLGLCLDVTAVKQDADDAAARAESVALALDAGQIVAWDHDVRTGISRRAGPVRAVYRVTASSTGSLAELARAMPPADAAKLYENIARLTTEGGDVEVDVSPIHPDAGGHPVRLRVIGRAHRGPDGQPTRLVGVTLDVSERTAMEQALRRSESKFHELFRLAPHAMVLVRLSDRVIVEASDSFVRMAGRPRAEVVGSAAGPEPGSTPSFEAIEALWQQLEAGQPFHGARVAARGRDDMMQLVVSAEILEIDGSAHALLSLEDVTDFVRAQEAVRESEARFQELVGTLDDVFWLVDPRTERNVYLSPAADRVWGRSPAYTTRAEWLATIHPDDRERMAQLGIHDQGMRGLEYRIVRPDGAIRWIRSVGYLVRDASGEVVRVAGLSQDVTARREIEEQLREAQKMESLGRLAGGVAHDLNNILTVVDTCTEMLTEVVPDEVEGRELVTELQRASARASSLTQQLLVFSRREIVSPKAVELDAAIADTIKMLRRLIGEDVTIQLDLNARDASVWIDPGSLAQLLVNLAVNAREAMPHGGTLTLASACVELSLEECSLRRSRRGAAELRPQPPEERGDVLSGPLSSREEVASHRDMAPGSFLRLSVADTGIGMSAEVRARLFEPFFTTKPAGRGNGLGLSVVHGIVDRVGGFVDVESTEGVGTTFVIHLPRLARPSASPSPAPRESGRGETVLFVEDDEAVRRIACTALRSRGYAVLTAASGEEALDALGAGTHSVDLVVTDVVMPGMDGRQFVERARARHPWLRVLYTSGYTDDDVLLRGVRQAEEAFLPKPYSIATMIAKVREVLDRARPSRT